MKCIMQISLAIKSLCYKFLQIFRPSKMNLFIKCVIRGDYVKDLEATAFNEFIEDEICRSDFQNLMFESENHLERVVLMNKDFPEELFKYLLNDLENIFQKDENIVNQLQEKGDDFLGKYDFKMSVRCYNLAVLFAPPRSKCLARIYARRALIFYWLKEEETFLANLELAINHNCSEDKERLLLILKKRIMTGKKKVVTLENKSAVDLREYRDHVIFNVEGRPNPKIQYAANCVQIKSNKEKGRYLTTDRQIKPGTTLIVEEPFCTVLQKLTKWDTDHCSKCLKKIKSTIPCDTCVFVNYCSETCKTDDLKGHKYECLCLPYLHAIRSASTLHLALKAICKEGPAKLYKRWKKTKSVSNIEENDDSQKGLNPETGKYDSDYHQLLHLKSHIHTHLLGLCVWIASSVVNTLDYMTDFFDQNEEFDEPDFKLYVMSLFLTHCVSFPYNTFGLTEDREIEASKVPVHFKIERVEYACGIYPLSSLLCHSCNPTVFRLNLGNGKMAIVTNRKLNPGDEMQISYGFGFISDNSKNRGIEIEAIYNFTCKCIACTFNWPSYEEIANSGRKYLCPNCSDKYKNSQINQAKLCVLACSNDIGFCLTCKAKTELSKIKKYVKTMEKNVYVAEDLIKEGKPVQAIPLLTNSIVCFQTSLAPPARMMILAQMHLVDAYSMINGC